MTVATPGLAAASSKQQFVAGSTTYHVSVPDGFCLPKGDELVEAKYYASLDDTNHTPVDLERCGTFNIDYTLVKFAKDNEPISLPRAVFVSVLARDFEEEVAEDEIDSAVGDVRDDMAEKTEGELTLGDAEFGYIGHDKDCVYLGGRMEVVVGTERFWRRVASCITIVGDRVFSIHSYANEDLEISVETLKRRSNRVALSITAQ